jgi:hypothetical protein
LVWPSFNQPVIQKEGEKKPTRRSVFLKQPLITWKQQVQLQQVQKQLERMQQVQKQLERMQQVRKQLEQQRRKRLEQQRLEQVLVLEQQLLLSYRKQPKRLPTRMRSTVFFS